MVLRRKKPEPGSVDTLGVFVQNVVADEPPPPPKRKRRAKKKPAAAKVFPPSRWRAIRTRYASVADAAALTAGETAMSKRLAKQLAYPRRRFRSVRAHGRQGNVRKGWRW